MICDSAGLPSLPSDDRRPGGHERGRSAFVRSGVRSAPALVPPWKAKSPRFRGLSSWAVTGSNCRPPACKARRSDGQGKTPEPRLLRQALRQVGPGASRNLAPVRDIRNGPGSRIAPVAAASVVTRNEGVRGSNPRVGFPLAGIFGDFVVCLDDIAEHEPNTGRTRHEWFDDGARSSCGRTSRSSSSEASQP